MLQAGTIRLLALGFGLWALGFGLVACKKDASAEASLSMPCAQLPSCVSFIKTALVRKIIDSKSGDKISLEEIQKYDLNFPGSVKYKDSKEWSIFYGFSSLELSKETQHLQSMVSASSNDGKLIFTISNRVEGLGTEAPELMAIIPNFKEIYCQKVMQDLSGIQSTTEKVLIPKINEPPNLLPHPEIVAKESIVTLPRILKGTKRDWDSGCFNAQGKYYYFYTLYSF